MRRVKPSTPSVSLFPFMSILACLVGTIVVMICILTVIQANHMGGRPKEEVAQAMEFVKANKEIEASKEQLLKVEQQIQQVASEKSQQEKLRDELEQRVIKLRLQLETAQNADKVSRDLQKELEQAILQLAEMAKEKPPIAKEIERLKQELAARKKDPKDLLAKVVVQPGGSGIAQEGRLYFAEATYGAITLYQNKTDKTRITAGSIGTDKQYDEFLQKIAAQRGATLVFLIRDDGWGAYSRAAGWAEGTFKVKTGKLPIPSKGAIDLAQFERFMAP